MRITAHLLRGALALLAQLFFRASIALAAPVPTPNVPALIGDSDVIVTGRLPGSPGQPGKLALPTLHVDRAIKGAAFKDAKLGLDSRQYGMGPFPIYGIFFLRGTSPALLRADPKVGSLVAAPPGFEMFGEQPKALNEIAAELVSVFAIPADVAADPRLGLAHLGMIVTVPHGRNRSGRDIVKWERASPLRIAEDVYVRAWDPLRSIPDDVKRPFLLKIIDSNGPIYGRLSAYATLLWSGDTSRLTVATAYLLHPSEQARATNDMLKLALHLYPFPESDAAFFVNILASSNEGIRESAAYQLSMMHSVAALRAMEVALRDEDPDVRQSALAAICPHVHVCGDEDKSGRRTPKNIQVVADAFHLWLESAPP
jgi:hypothetical protein